LVPKAMPPEVRTLVQRLFERYQAPPWEIGLPVCKKSLE
jgi:hypothetical protein